MSKSTCSARASTWQQRDSHLEYLPVELLVRLGVPNAEESLGGDVVSDIAEVVNGDRKCYLLRRRVDVLSPVGAEPHPQHRMARRQVRRRRLQPRGIDCSTVEFDIQVPGHATERLALMTSYPHGVLHGGERKRVVGSTRRRHSGVRLRGNIIAARRDQ